MRAVVFDCDGVLVDSEAAWLSALRDAASRQGVVIDDRHLASMLGGSVPEAIEYIERELGHAVDEGLVEQEILDAVIAKVSEGVRAMDGAVELLTSLHGTRPLAVASNGSTETVLASLHAAGIPLIFDVIVALDDSLRPKPAPDLYAEACARLGVRSVDTCAIEDSVRGAQSAKSAGMAIIGVGEATELKTYCDLFVPSLRDSRIADFIDK